MSYTSGINFSIAHRSFRRALYLFLLDEEKRGGIQDFEKNNKGRKISYRLKMNGKRLREEACDLGFGILICWKFSIFVSFLFFNLSSFFAPEQKEKSSLRAQLGFLTIATPA